MEIVFLCRLVLCRGRFTTELCRKEATDGRLIVATFTTPRMGVWKTAERNSTSNRATRITAKLWSWKVSNRTFFFTWTETGGLKTEAGCR